MDHNFETENNLSVLLHTLGQIINKLYALFLFGWLHVPTCSLTCNQPGTPVYKMTTRG
jgi:hypothetical protein